MEVAEVRGAWGKERWGTGRVAARMAAEREKWRKLVEGQPQGENQKQDKTQTLHETRRGQEATQEHWDDTKGCGD
jgi:hypothetical protein